MSELENRRPLKTRGQGWSRNLAARLAAMGVTPDALSASSLVFAGAGAGLFWVSGASDGAARAILLAAAGACIQLRLLVNMMDGLVAVEHGKGSTSGPIWNELPDRLTDALFLVGAGYGAARASGMDLGAALGWLCAVLAVLTAYVRELGRALGQPADFCGPMAKPHRMFALTCACLVAAAEPLWGWRGEALLAGLAIIAAGAALTAWRRTARLAARLRDAGPI